MKPGQDTGSDRKHVTVHDVTLNVLEENTMSEQLKLTTRWELFYLIVRKTNVIGNNQLF